MKNILCKLAIIIVLFTSITFSQQLYEDVVYLKNGSIIHGIIIEQVPNVSLKIKTHDGNVFVFSFSDLEKTTKEYLSQKDFIFQNGIYGECHVGILTGGSIITDNNNYKVSDLILTIGGIGGYRINENMRFGFGFEYNKYPSTIIVPLFTQFRFNYFKSSNITPISFFDLGYTLSWIEHVPGIAGDGIFMSIGSGIEIYFNEKNCIGLEISYRKQWATIFRLSGQTRDFFGNIINYTSPSKINGSYNFLNILVSYQF